MGDGAGDGSEYAAGAGEDQPRSDRQIHSGRISFQRHHDGLDLEQFRGGVCVVSVSGRMGGRPIRTEEGIDGGHRVVFRIFSGDGSGAAIGVEPLVWFGVDVCVDALSDWGRGGVHVTEFGEGGGLVDEYGKVRIRNKFLQFGNRSRGGDDADADCLDDAAVGLESIV